MTYRFLLTATLASLAVAAPAQNAKPAAAPAPQPLSRAAFMQKVDNTFVAVDANKDGFMEKAEIEAAEVKVLNAEKTSIIRRREALFKALDANKDGNLTLAEFNARVAAVAVKPNATPVLGRLDTNKDGKVSLAENRTPSMAQFDRADANKDGTLSAAEQKARVKR